MNPRIPTVDDTTAPQEDGGYILTPYDKKFAETRWSLASKAERRTFCGRFGDGGSDAWVQDWVREVEKQGVPVSEESEVRIRAMLEYTAITYC